MSRELLLQIADIENTADAFKVAYNMMKALRDEQITDKQYNMLSFELEMITKFQGIETKNEICSLF
jgi:hypothetical protein